MMSSECKTKSKMSKRVSDVLRGESGRSKAVIVVIVALIIGLVSVGVYALTGDYALFVSGNKIAVVEDKKASQELIDQYLAEKQSTIGPSARYNGSIEFIRGEYDEAEARVSSNEALALTKQNVPVVAEATMFVVNGNEKIAVANEDAANNILERMKLEFGAPNKDNATVMKTCFLEDVKFETKVLNINRITSSDKAYKYLANGSHSPVAYLAKDGDSFKDIAHIYGLSINQLNKLNPTIEDTEDLTEGRLVVIKEIVPIINYAVKYKYNEELGIAPTITYEDDATLPAGTFKVITQGQTGLKSCYISAVQLNGTIKQKTTIAEKIIYPAVTKKVIRGTMIREGITVGNGLSSREEYRGLARGTGIINWPMGGTITSKFGPRSRGFHTGLDIAAPIGTSVAACDSGEVVRTGWGGGYGNLIVIAHGNGVETWYAHLSSIDVQVGQTVSQGEHIGACGSTGNSTGPHVHLEVRVNGSCCNPINFLQ